MAKNNFIELPTGNNNSHIKTVKFDIVDIPTGNNNSHLKETVCAEVKVACAADLPSENNNSHIKTVKFDIVDIPNSSTFINDSQDANKHMPIIYPEVKKKSNLFANNNIELPFIENELTKNRLFKNFIDNILNRKSLVDELNEFATKLNVLNITLKAKTLFNLSKDLLQSKKHDFNKLDHISPFKCALMSDDVYARYNEGQTNINYINYLKLWDFYKFEEKGYYATLCVNFYTKQIALAFKGSSISFEELLKIDKEGDWIFNFKSIVGHEINDRHSKVHELTLTAVELAHILGFSLTFTGHSLGGWLAKLSLYYYYSYIIKDINVGNIMAVGFDSPGFKNAFDFLTACNPTFNCNNNQEILLKEQMNNFQENYLSHLNFINCIGEHMGVNYHIKVNLKKLLNKSFIKILNDMEFKELYFGGLFSNMGHKLQLIIKEFNPDTGLPKLFFKIVGWPSISFKKELTHNHDELIYKPINTLLKTNIVSVENNLLYDISRTGFKWIKGDIDTVKYFELHKMLVMGKYFDNNGSSVSTYNIDPKFKMVRVNDANNMPLYSKTKQDLVKNRVFIFEDADLDESEYRHFKEHTLTKIKVIKSNLSNTDLSNKTITTDKGSKEEIEEVDSKICSVISEEPNSANKKDPIDAKDNDRDSDIVTEKNIITNVIVENTPYDSNNNSPLLATHNKSDINNNNNNNVNNNSQNLFRNTELDEFYESRANNPAEEIHFVKNTTASTKQKKVLSEKDIISITNAKAQPDTSPHKHAFDLLNFANCRADVKELEMLPVGLEGDNYTILKLND